MRSRILFGLAFLIACLWLGGFAQSLVTASLWQPSNMPIVFVDPPMVTASVGEYFTIYVKIFNLSNNFYIAGERWDPGELLSPPVQNGSSYNYSLGNLYGFQLEVSWDPAVLEYINHTRTMPVEDYPDGILYGPVGWADEVNQSLGTYLIIGQEAVLTPVFNCPNETATIFYMTFRGKTEGMCMFNITRLDMAFPRAWPEYLEAESPIPYWILDGQVDVIPELHLLMLPSFLLSTLAAVLLKLKLRRTNE